MIRRPPRSTLTDTLFPYPTFFLSFIPPNEGGFSYGWPGVFRAASVIFFAYIGFETVSTAGAEARNPQRDLPIGILGALTICTLLYIRDRKSTRLNSSH